MIENNTLDLRSQIVVSDDGSHTVRSVQFDVTYHSIHGAVQESMTVFIEAGLRHLLSSRSRMTILEMGFGTGLNALLTYKESLSTPCEIVYHGVEAFPLGEGIVSQLNYSQILGVPQSIIANMHGDAHNDIRDLSLNDCFRFNKHITSLEDFNTKEQFDLIYYDAFAPTAQPELWEEPIITKLYNMLNDQGVLVTYCAKGSFKRTLRSVGFGVEALPGPPRKREMTRATKVVHG